MSSNEPNSRLQEDLAWAEQHMDRRSFMSLLGTGAAAVSGAGLLAAWGGSSLSGPSAASAAAVKPRRGGQLRVGLTGGASSDTLYPLAEVTIPDLARSPQLFNSLIQFDSNGQLVNTLAEEITPNKNATEWTIRVKRGITFHNGKDLTADDVIYTFRQILKKRAAQAKITGTIWEPVTPHGMRAGFVTTAYKNGVPDEEIMGHTRHRADVTRPVCLRRL